MKPVHTNNRLPDIGDVGHSGGEDQLTGSADNFTCSNAVLLSRFDEEAKVPPATNKGDLPSARRRKAKMKPTPIDQGTMGYIAQSVFARSR
jgi:hypothetical protein